MNELSPGQNAAAAELRRQMGEMLMLSNPSEAQGPGPRRAPRIPMSSQQQRLKVKDIPGYRLYWFREENVPAALDAYYEFVKRDELTTNPIGIGTNAMDGGNTDLGTNVSLVSGQNAAGVPVRLILMKIKLEYFVEDQRLIAQKNSIPMEAIFGDEAMMYDKQGNLIEQDSHTYRGTALFQRSRQKAKPAGMRELKARLEALEKRASDRPPRDRD